MGLRRIVAVLAMGAVVFGAGPAAADDSAFNKEGFWSVGRGEADSKSCAASIGVKSGEMFLLVAKAGEVTFAVGAKKPMRRGRKGVLSTEAYSFEFEPGYSADGDSLFFDEPMTDRVLAALRLASALFVTVDRRQVLNVDVEGTGFEGALDAVIACSNGKSGWWGPGVGAPAITAGLNKEGKWTLESTDMAETCAAYASTDERTALVLIGAAGAVGVAMRSKDATLPSGREGLIETNDYSFTFEPANSGATYFASAQPLDQPALSALRRANELRVSLDGKVAADVYVRGSGLPGLLDDLIACSRGEKGWWGAGAKQP